MQDDGLFWYLLLFDRWSSRQNDIKWRWFHISGKPPECRTAVTNTIFGATIGVFHSNSTRSIFGECRVVWKLPDLLLSFKNEDNEGCFWWLFVEEINELSMIWWSPDNVWDEGMMATSWNTQEVQCAGDLFLAACERSAKHQFEAPAKTCWSMFGKSYGDSAMANMSCVWGRVRGLLVLGFLFEILVISVGSRAFV